MVAPCCVRRFASFSVPKRWPVKAGVDAFIGAKVSAEGRVGNDYAGVGVKGEAMAGLGIPTTRALAVVGADLPVRREEIESAAVVARVAPSFVRFGSFEHWAAHGRGDELRLLADYVITTFRPECPSSA